MADAGMEQLLATLRRRGGIGDRVLDAMAAVDRGGFVPEGDASEAYADRPLPIGHGATISQPWVVARMLEVAAPRAGDRLLDVGTGSWYAAAVAARLAGEVVGVELVPELAERARGALAAVGADHVEVHVGDGHLGWPGGAPYDVVLVAAAAATVPPALVEQLADGGRLVLPVGPVGGVQELRLLRREGDDVVEHHVAAVRFVPLVDGA